MLTLHVLGSGSGLPSARRDTTSLLVSAADGWTLIDCPGSVVHRIARRGLSVAGLRRIVITHDHVDHLYGFPHLLHAMAVRGDCPPLTLMAPKPTLTTIRRMVELHALEGPRYPQLLLAPIPSTPRFLVSDEAGVRLWSSPARHGRETIALRVETADCALGHSSDTQPSDEVADLCADVDLLLHDCGGLHEAIEEFGQHHSSARQAGEVARRAEARHLGLIHIPPTAENHCPALIREAEAAFGRPVRVLADGDLYRLPHVGQEPGRRAPDGRLRTSSSSAALLR